MPDLLFELFSEEIPARMQARAAEDLRRMVTDRLVDAGLVYEGAAAFATPRRLALAVKGIPPRQPDLKEEKKGPRVGAPDNAVQGFLKSAGLASIAEATVQKDPKKGDFYVALIEKPGRAAIDVLAEILPLVIRTFPWPKSMRWGERSARPGALAWVRPLHAIVATFGPETEEPETVNFSVDGITAGNVTQGHRFLAPHPFRVKRFTDYAAKLEKAKVVLDPTRRKDIILADARHLAFAQGFELVEDAGLIEENAGLVEWPVTLMGSFDAAFLKLPPEVIRTTIRANQKCFVVKTPASSPLPAGERSPPPFPPPLVGEGRVGAGERAAAAPASSPLPAGERSTSRGSALSGKGAAKESASSAAPPHPALHADLSPTGRGEESLANRSAMSGEGAAGALSGRSGPPHPALRADLSPPGRGEESLANRFILVANTEAADGGAIIVAGNERVIRARLADAKFFYDTDRRTRLEDRLPKFTNIVFHEKLGTQAMRIVRIERLAAELAPLVGADVETAKRAARLAKADLLTEMVGEFPELQGLMGKYYARAQSEEESVALACEDHYKPLGPADRVPTNPVAVAVALADKLDTLGGFWWINEKPSGSKDPYGLRRAALGVIRIVLENELRIRFFEIGPKIMAANIAALVTEEAHARLKEVERWDQIGLSLKIIEILKNYILSSFSQAAANKLAEEIDQPSFEIFSDLLAFFADRLKVQLREQGARHDLVDAVFALEGQDDLLLIVLRVQALAQFLDTEDGKNLLAGYKRATNILRIEEKRDTTEYTGAPDPEFYRQAEEWELARAIDVAVGEAAAAVAAEDFAAAMTAMAKLRPHVDAFFDQVTVNADDPVVRVNRLRLLNQIRHATRAVADFSRIEG